MKTDISVFTPSIQLDLSWHYSHCGLHKMAVGCAQPEQASRRSDEKTWKTTLRWMWLFSCRSLVTLLIRIYICQIWGISEAENKCKKIFLLNFGPMVDLGTSSYNLAIFTGNLDARWWMKMGNVFSSHTYRCLHRFPKHCWASCWKRNSYSQSLSSWPRRCKAITWSQPYRDLISTTYYVVSIPKTSRRMSQPKWSEASE